MKVIQRKQDIRMENGRPVEYDTANRKNGTVDGKEHKIPFKCPVLKQGDVVSAAWDWVKSFFPAGTATSVIENALWYGIKLRLNAIASQPFMDKPLTETSMRNKLYAHVAALLGNPATIKLATDLASALAEAEGEDAVREIFDANLGTTQV